MQFVSEFGTDTFMRKVPPEFLQYQGEADAFHHTSWQKACFMSFLEWLQSPPKPRLFMRSSITWFVGV
jgi:hypothetical protein